MAFQIEVGFTSGATLYAVIKSPSGQFWNTSGSPAFENFNSGHWANYAIPLTEVTGTGIYTATYPAGIAGVLTTEYIYQQAGGSPATTDAPNIASSRSQGVSLAQINGDSVSLLNLYNALLCNQLGHAVTGTLLATQFTTDLANALNSSFNGRIILFVTGSLAGQAAVITAYNGTSKAITCSAFTGSPSNGDTFVIV